MKVICVSSDIYSSKAAQKALRAMDTKPPTAGLMTTLMVACVRIRGYKPNPPTCPKINLRDQKMIKGIRKKNRHSAAQNYVYFI